MRFLNTRSLSGMIALCILACTSCQEEDEISGLGKTTRPPQEIPDDFVDHSGGLPYPEIIENTYISDIEQFAHTKCQAWRIEWPGYEDDVDPNQIPSLFSVSSGFLYSINFINSIDPANKAILDFSLYYDDMLKTPFYVDEIWNWYEDYTAETTRFVKYNISLKNLQDWVTQRPSLFEYHYTHSMDAKAEEVSYQEGDFFLMWLTNDDLYGGIRIVSNEPKIIEVYIARENI